MKITRALACLLAGTLIAGTLQAGTFVRVTIDGVVDFNMETLGDLGTVQPGDPVTVTFLLNSDIFLNSGAFPIRGYEIKRETFSIEFPTYTMPLLAPLPLGTKTYFCIADEHASGDGFFLSTSVNSPLGVPLQQSGTGGPFISNFRLAYPNSKLTTLNLQGVLGTYDATGLTLSDFGLDDGPTNVVGLLFDTMTIGLAVPWIDLGGSSIGINGQPALDVFGPLSAGSTMTIQVTDAAPNAPMLVWASLNPVPFAALGGTVQAHPFLVQLPRTSDGAGSFSQAFSWPAGIPPGLDVTLQFLVADASSIYDITLTNGARWTTF